MKIPKKIHFRLIKPLNSHDLCGGLSTDIRRRKCMLITIKALRVNEFLHYNVLTRQIGTCSSPELQSVLLYYSSQYSIVRGKKRLN